MDLLEWEITNRPNLGGFGRFVGIIMIFYRVFLDILEKCLG